MDDQASASQIDFLDFTAELVTAYVANNALPITEVPGLIATVHAALRGLKGMAPAETAKSEKPAPVQIRKSITRDALISFEDGKPYKTLRRHLTMRGLSPEAYREKWGLPADYPMTAASYSEQRSELAKSLGLGQMGRKAAPAGIDDGEISEPAAPAKRRGRPPGRTKASASA